MQERGAGIAEMEAVLLPLCPDTTQRDGRVVECGGLENR